MSLMLVARVGAQRHAHDGAQLGTVVFATSCRPAALGLNRRTYRATGKMTEKYDVVDLQRRAGGGEYPTQDGFGWSNGVALALAAQTR